jgi:pyruvate formate lyase activating enzyme
MRTYHEQQSKVKETGKEVKVFPEIKGFQQTTLLDWEGRVASIIFLGGCNFRCNFCHSRDLVLNAGNLDTVPLDSIDNFLRSKKGWIDGVEITGGEPTLYGEALVNLIRHLKDMGFMVKLDTNGTNPGLLAEMLHNGFLDYIAMDIKAPLNKGRYRDVTGVDADIDSIIRSKDIIISSLCGYEFRTTIIPGIISVSCIKEIAQSLLPAKRYRLQQFRPMDTLDPAYLSLKPYPEKDLEKMEDTARCYIPDTRLRK